MGDDIKNRLVFFYLKEQENNSYCNLKKREFSLAASNFNNA